MLSPCGELETALKNSEEGIPERVLRHAEGCPACAAALESWKRIAEAAPSLRRSWESPELWPRIERSLAEASAQKAAGAFRRPASGKGLWASALSWRPAAAAALLLVLCLWGTWSLLSRFQPDEGESRRLLTDQALKEHPPFRLLLPTRHSRPSFFPAGPSPALPENQEGLKKNS